MCAHTCVCVCVYTGEWIGGVKGERKNIKFSPFLKKTPPASGGCLNFYLIFSCAWGAEPGIKVAPGCSYRIPAMKSLASWRCMFGALQGRPVAPSLLCCLFPDIPRVTVGSSPFPGCLGVQQGKRAQCANPSVLKNAESLHFWTW